MDSWLITGASGFLGSNAGLALAGRATRVGMSRTAAPAAAFDSRHIVDLLDDAGVRDLVAATRPAVILHCAALASHEQCEEDPALAARVNVDATRTLAEAAAGIGARFVYVSTDAVFDGQRGGYREEDPPRPFSVYGQTKLRGEQAALAVCPGALVVRTSIFGWSPSGTRSILEFFVNGLRRGLPLPGYTDFVVSAIYAPHLVGLIEELVHGEHSGLVHVAAADALSKYAFGRAVAAEFGLPEGLVTATSAASGGHATARTRDLSLDTGRLAGLIGHRPPTQADGIRSAYDDQSAVTAALREPEGVRR